MKETVKYEYLIGTGEDGSFVACRIQAPVFCVHRETEQEAIATASAIITDYDKRFGEHRHAKLSASSTRDIPTVWPMVSHTTRIARVA